MENGKINDFVNYLLNNPNVSGNSLIISEGVIINFLVSNFNQLQVTFKSPQFFPEKNPKEVLSMIIDELKSRVVDHTIPQLNDHIDKLELSFLVAMDKSGSYSTDMYRQYLKKYISGILLGKEVRMQYNSVLNILNHRIIERYIEEIFAKRTPTYFELTRVQRNNMQALEYINYLKLLLLIKNTAYCKGKIEGFSDAEVAITDFINIPTTLTKYIDKRASTLFRELPGISADVIKMAIKANINNTLVTPEDASAKFLFILCSRFQNYQEIKKADRGAESPDKSWFAISRKNAAYYGYDKRILEDLYLIAGNNEW
jgi:hypothetical protein